MIFVRNLCNKLFYLIKEILYLCTMTKNKNIIIFFLFAIAFLSANILKAQYTISPSDTLEVYQELNTHSYDKILINNNTSDTLHINWRTTQYDTLCGTYFDFCASGFCLLGFPATGSFPPIPPGSFGFAGSHLWTGNTPVTSVAGVHISVAGSSAAGDSLTFILHAINTAGIENKQMPANHFTVYPNPVIDKVIIKTIDNKSNQTKYSLYNLLGELIYTTISKSSLTEIPLNNVNNGIYLLHIESGNKKNITKIVVSK